MPISFEAVMLPASRSEIGRIYSRSTWHSRASAAPAMALQLNSRMDLLEFVAALLHHIAVKLRRGCPAQKPVTARYSLTRFEP
jgi:hypothetical protein